MKPIDVLIGIQARSNSTRFPKKIYEIIGDKRVLDHVIDQAKSAADHINHFTRRASVNCQVAVLHPSDDIEIVKAFKNSGAILIGGPENDVLSRFVTAQRMTSADYVVRLTSDCPLILDFVIAKHIHTAAFRHAYKKYDYISNIEEKCRLIADGFDCELLSREALDWLDRMATEAFDREHVTTALRRLRPKHLRQAFIASKLDTSRMKMSVDTPEDLERIREYYHEREHKLALARTLFPDATYEL